MATKRNMTREEMEAEVNTKIQLYAKKGFPEAARIHQLIMEAEPTLCPRLWYGMPGYAKTKDSAVLVFFRKDRYMTFGYTETVEIVAGDSATTDDLVPCSWFFTELNSATEAHIQEVVRRAVA